LKAHTSPLVLRSAAIGERSDAVLRTAMRRVSKDEATARASWFETAFGLLTMRVWIR
jgi:hypothetical protein